MHANLNKKGHRVRLLRINNTSVHPDQELKYVWHSFLCFGPASLSTALQEAGKFS